MSKLRLRPLLPWLLLILPFLLLLTWISNHAFKGFFYDDWALIAELFPTESMQPSWEGTFTTHAGHSIPWLRISTYLAVHGGQGDPRFMLVLTLMLAVATAALLAKLARATQVDTSVFRYLIIGMAVASPIFGQAWLWWICWPIFVPFFCVVCGALLLYGQSFRWGRFLVCVALGVFAAHAHGSGGMVWLALLPSFLPYLRSAPKFPRMAAWAIYASSGALAMYSYLAAAVGVSQDNELSIGVQLLKLTEYALILLGGSLAEGLCGHSLLIVQICGLVFCGGAAYLAWLGWGSTAISTPTRSRLHPWMSIALFGLLAGAAIAAGRSWLPLYQALAGRYLLLTYPLWLGLYFGLQVMRTSESDNFGRRWQKFCPAATPVTLILLVNVWLSGYARLRHDHAEFLAATSSLNFARLFPTNTGLAKGFPSIPLLISTAEKLDQHDLLSGITLFKDDSLASLGHPLPLTPMKGGHITRATMDGEGRLLVEGYAYLNEADRPADLVILSWESKTQPQAKIFNLISMPLMSDFYEVPQRLRRPELFTPWRVLISPAQLPEPNGIIKAWAFDQEKRRIHRLRNNLTIKDGKIDNLEALARSAGTIELETRSQNATIPKTKQ